MANKPNLNSGSKRYSKGLYEIRNIDKYIGNPSECIFRSSWELKFMVYCDLHHSVKKWGSETAQIQYFMKNDRTGVMEPHRYFPDFYIEKIDPNDPDVDKKYFIELKPFKEYKPDFVKYESDGSLRIITPGSRKSLKAFENFEYQVKTFQKNLAKWQAATIWCNKRYMEFVVIHEHILKEWGVL